MLLYLLADHFSPQEYKNLGNDVNGTKEICPFGSNAWQLSYRHICYSPKIMCSVGTCPLKSPCWSTKLIPMAWQGTLPFDVVCLEHLMSSLQHVVTQSRILPSSHFACYINQSHGEIPLGSGRSQRRFLPSLENLQMDLSLKKKKLETKSNNSLLCISEGKEDETYFSLEDSEKGSFASQCAVGGLRIAEMSPLFPSITLTFLKLLQVGKLIFWS